MLNMQVCKVTLNLHVLGFLRHLEQRHEIDDNGEL